MSTSEVKDILGKPDEQVTDASKVTENAYNDLRDLKN